MVFLQYLRTGVGTREREMCACTRVLMPSEQSRTQTKPIRNIYEQPCLTSA